ncbi:MAG: dynamin family protein [Lachnospiraceae bacterium]|nr:dynamin family protein [Lachnospiraceae bacterium]
MTEEKKKELFEIISQGQALLENQDNAELYDVSYLYDFINTGKELKSSLKKAAAKGRKLVIGIIGAVKAGKSSFLNALLFDGEQYLPKAITPSTATLTKISYAETPKAVVHFFSREDWEQIEKYVASYETKLEKEYADYCRKFEEGKKKDKQNGGKEREFFSKEKYEIRCFRSVFKDDRILSAVELKRMASANGVLEYLGKEVELEGNIIEKLNDYIDAKGTYTAVVKNVELMVDNESLEGIEIIDTPGLCDPVVSRGQKTKEELHNCDVVFLLSSVCEFLPADTINLMVNSLPSAGVDEVLVVGSRFDDGITDDKGGDFRTKAKKTKESCDKSFFKNMEMVKKSGQSNELTAKIEKSDRLYISSMCYVLSKKIKKGMKFTAEEAKVYEQLQEYSGFKDEYLSQISGLNEVKKKLNAILKRKEDIIAQNDSRLIENAANNFAKILFDIKTYVETNNIKLRNMSKEEVEDKSQNIRDALILSRKQMTTLFETTGLQCEKKLISTKSILTQEMANYTSFKTTTDTSEDVYTVQAGFLGLRKDTVKTTVVTKKASTAQVKINLQNYNARSMQIINDEFTYLFNQEQFVRKIKEIIMKAFAAGDTDYEKEDILLPVEKLLVKLTLPAIDVDPGKYIDLLNSRFINGYAENNEIHELSSMQAELLGKIRAEYDAKVTENGQTISKIMQQESVGFADELEKKFSGDMQKLLVQMEEQQKYLELNAAFATQLGELIRKFKEMANAV